MKVDDFDELLNIDNCNLLKYPSLMIFIQYLIKHPVVGRQFFDSNTFQYFNLKQLISNKYYSKDLCFDSAIELRK